MNSISKFIKNKLIEITLRKNRLLGKIGLLPTKTETFGTVNEVLKILNSSNINLHLYK